MAEDDIYCNKGKYERFITNLDQLVVAPEKAPSRRGQRFYYCKNPENIEYFRKLAMKFDAKDLSYIRRLRLFGSLLIICHASEKNLGLCDRDDIDSIVAFMHTRCPSPKTKADFVRDIRHMWKLLFPEEDERGRIDDSLVPYPVRHLSPRIDKSREKSRKDKLAWEEIERIITYFSSDPCIQSFLSVMLDSYARPQELGYTKIEDFEILGDYGKLHISEHGKEGTGFLELIDCFPFLVRWYHVHPFRTNPNAFLFLNSENQQLKPTNVNDKLKIACRELGIDKPVTCYSFKRNGITHSRLRGLSDVEIQHKARWTSTKQLKTYDMSVQEDSFKRQLMRRGLVELEKDDGPKTKVCPYCHNSAIGFSEDTCTKCLRIIDPKKIRENIQEEQDKLEKMKQFLDAEVMKELFELKQTVERLKRPETKPV